MNQPQTLQGIAVVTGAASGIGRECALAFAEAGATGIVLADINRQAVEATARESTKQAKNSAFRALPIAIDVSNHKEVESLVSQTLANFGRIDFNVNCAGVAMRLPTSFLDLPMDEWERVHRANVHGVFYCMQKIANVMKTQPPIKAPSQNGERKAGRGAIVNVASIHSFRGAPGTAHYTASKHAVLGLTRNAALDLAKDGIRVNAVCPTWVNTSMINSNPVLAEVHGPLQRAVPLGRVAEPEEIADVVLFLCSPKASYVTAAAWMVDGGFSSSAKI